MAGTSVEAGLRVADGVGPLLTVRARKSLWTAARVGSLSGVEAGGAVLAGLVVGAIVEVLVAEEAAPSFAAVALPGFLARPVLAAGITQAVGAQRTAPTAGTPETRSRNYQKKNQTSPFVSVGRPIH